MRLLSLIRSGYFPSSVIIRRWNVDQIEAVGNPGIEINCGNK